MLNVASSSPRRMHVVRRDHGDAPFPQRRRARQPGERRFAAISQASAPTIARAEASTRSQLLMKAVFCQVAARKSASRPARRRAETPPPSSAAPAAALREPSTAAAARSPRAPCRGIRGRRGEVAGTLTPMKTVALAVLARTGLEEPLQDVGGPASACWRSLRLASRPVTAHRSYDSRRADADCLIRYVCGSAQNALAQLGEARRRRRS